MQPEACISLQPADICTPLRREYLLQDLVLHKMNDRGRCQQAPLVAKRWGQKSHVTTNAAFANFRASGLTLPTLCAPRQVSGVTVLTPTGLDASNALLTLTGLTVHWESTC